MEKFSRQRVHRNIIVLFYLLFFAIASQLSTEEIVFNDMLEHKQQCLEEIASDPYKGGCGSYPLSRVFETVNADDVDCIPKIPNAGKIYEENGLRYQLMHNGIKVVEHGYYGAWMSDIIHALRGHHEPQEEKVFYEVLKHIPSNATMIELGSYWGYYSLWFSTAVQGAKNYLIEPEPSNMEIGKKNFTLNNKQAHFCLGYIRMYENDSFMFNKAQRIHLDTFLKENQIEHVHIVHSDIQGAEYEMLRSCEESIKNHKIDYFFISTHNPGVHAACKKLLLESNYLIISEHSMNESCSVDGLIVGRRKDVSGPSYIPLRKYFHD